MDNSTSIIMPIHNQEEIIQDVVMGFATNMTENVKEVIFILDGCTDNTEHKLDMVLGKINRDIKIIYSDDVWEVIASNLGLKMSSCKYSLTIQDDMIVTEPEFDKRLLKPFLNLGDEVFAVTSRNAQNETIAEDGCSLRYFNMAGRDAGTHRDIFAIRDVIVRGTILWDNEKLKALNYLDEDFAPIDSDDKDICFRAFKRGWVVGSYVVDYISELSWGGTRKEGFSKWYASALKNQKLIIERHKNFLLGEKHDKDIIIK